MHPHDRLFRLAFSAPELAASELRALLPDALTERLDLSGLTAIEGTFVDDELRRSQCDVLMSTRLDGHTALVYVLMEHQSEPDPVMPLRMLKYMIKVWDRYRDGPLPVVIPVVVYPGRRPWNGPTDLFEMFGLDSELAAVLPGLPRMRLYVDDLSRDVEQRLRNSARTAAAQLVLLALRRAPGSTDVAAVLRGWREQLAELVATPSGLSLFAGLLTYIREVSETPERKLHELAARLGPEAEERYMTTADLLRREGEARGEVRGEVRAILTFLEARGITLTADQRERVAGCVDPVQLQTWIRRAAVVSDAEALFNA